MTTSALASPHRDAAGPSLSGLHDLAERHDDELLPCRSGDPELLPCRSGDPELWFAEQPSDVEHAKALCQDCPIRQLCLAQAKQRCEPWGVWGGELFLQGTVIPRKRPRGRPRKDAA